MIDRVCNNIVPPKTTEVTLKAPPIFFFLHVILLNLLQIARHGENRQKGMFAPNAGMLFPLEPSTCQSFDNGTLPLAEVDLRGNSYYSLTDKFHQITKKRTHESAFRSLDLCNLSANVNSSVAEQANAVMSRDR